MKRMTIDIEKEVFYQAISRMGILVDAEQIHMLVQAFASCRCIVDGAQATVAGYEEHTGCIRILLLSEDVLPNEVYPVVTPGTLYHPSTIRATAHGDIEYLDGNGDYVPIRGTTGGMTWEVGLNKKSG